MKLDVSSLRKMIAIQNNWEASMTRITQVQQYIVHSWAGKSFRYKYRDDQFETTEKEQAHKITMISWRYTSVILKGIEHSASRRNKQVFESLHLERCVLCRSHRELSFSCKRETQLRRETEKGLLPCNTVCINPGWFSLQCGGGEHFPC